MKKHSKGFTLVELLVVMSIMSFLSSIIFAAVQPGRAKARDAQRIAQIQEVQKALDLYYSNNGSYPANTQTLSYGENIPHNWSDLMSTLNSGGYIQASFTENNILEKFADIGLFGVAYAAAGFNYWKCSIQDPLYKTGGDYQYSYGYVASADGQSYKIRIYIENSSSSLFNTSQAGTFLDTNTTGNTACDKSINYYCTGRN